MAVAVALQPWDFEVVLPDLAMLVELRALLELEVASEPSRKGFSVQS